MVMHARKQAKLNDGYVDRKDTHLHQDMQYHSSLFADDSDDDGPLVGHISTHYQNKSSYIERNKEKRGSRSLAEKKVSHYLATGSLGRPIPMETSFSYSGEQGCVGTESSRGASSSTATNNGKQPSSSTGKEKEQVQKSAIRVLGDWSEHISSSGKRYYYNCKTEVSQWEKPKEWNSDTCKTPDYRSKDGRPRALVHAHANQISADSRASRHSSSSDHHPEQSRSHCTNSADNTSSESQHGRESTSSTTHPHYRDSRESTSSTTHPHYRDSRESRDSHLLSRENSRDMPKPGTERTHSTDSISNNTHYQLHQVALHRSGSTPGGNSDLPDSYHTDHKRLQHDGQFTSHSDYKRSDSLRRRRTDSQESYRYHDTGQIPIDDMEISPSPSPSPSSSRPSSTSGTPHLPPTSTPIAVSTTPSHNLNTTPGGHHNLNTTPGGHHNLNAMPGGHHNLNATPGGHHNLNATPGGHHNLNAMQSGHHSSPPLGNPIPTLVNRQTVNDSGSYDKTIQTLQELQKVLSMHIRAQQNTTNSRPMTTQPQPRIQPVATSSHQVTPAQHLIYPPSQNSSVVSTPMGSSSHQSYQGIQTQQTSVNTTNVGPGMPGEDGLGGRTSPVSATSSRSSCGSPTPSDSSSQTATVTSQALTAAAIKREETAKLTASLSNYYNEKLIGHVLGWQADMVEKQAGKLWEESMVNGSDQCSRISVKLKRARSQVRIAEIQSTLHEQRIMSSEQQRQEIENLKTPSSFLPSS